ncbi:MAG: YraN family protein [Bacillota bacterium]|nr:MAG: YraN family protein [Bacillota bacterium]
MTGGRGWGGGRLGRAAEEAALAFLTGHGLRVVARNWRCRMGEIDLVALEGPQVVFVEVKARRSARWGSPAAAVDRRKQERLWRLASLFLQSRGWSDRPCRFDVLALTLTGAGEWTCEWIRDAFQGTPDGRY